MKLIFCMLAWLTLFSVAVQAQDAAESWEQRKTQRFTPVTAEQRQAIAQAIPSKPRAEPSGERRVLVFYRCEGFIHTSIPHGNLALQLLGDKTDAFQIDLADQYEAFSSDNLQNYDAIILNNSSGMKFPSVTQRDALLDFVANGGGLVGIHAASDNFGEHPECRALVGGQFGGHPWGAGGTWAFKLDDPQHTLNGAFEGHGFWHTDEIYQYTPETYQGTEVLRILVSLDMSKEVVSERIKDGPREVPVSWLRRAGDGRVFYTNFGHREETYAHPIIMQHLLDGIQYALGDLEADATPTAELPERQPALAPDRP